MLSVFGFLCLICCNTSSCFLAEAFSIHSSAAITTAQQKQQQQQQKLPLRRAGFTTTATAPLFGRTKPSRMTATVSPSSSSSPPALSSFCHELINGDIPWNTLVGQADRALRLGIQLERSGMSRAAFAAFHEAATLYACVLESEDEFGYVTNIMSASASAAAAAAAEEGDDEEESAAAAATNSNNDDVTFVLAYVCCRLANLNLDALGDAKAAVRLYEQSAMMDPTRPSASTYDGMGRALEASGGGNNLKLALEAYRKSQELDPDNKRVAFRIGVVLDRLGREDEANEVFDAIRKSEYHIACLNDSWGYVRWHTRKVPDHDLNLYLGTRGMLKIALNAAMPLIREGGLVCEFGVASGRTIRMTQEILPLNVLIHGFDTFTGLPQASGDLQMGAYSTGGIIPKMDTGNVIFYKGLFQDTIGPFLKECDDNNGGGSSFLAYANIDCELYTSTLDILEGMHGKIRPGTILVFDEYICHPTWRHDEFRAWRECCKRFGWKYEYLAFSLHTKQAVVKVLDA